jgi:SAM-dependent methyltransferase
MRKIAIGDVKMTYLLHDYNKAWTCERAVEVPFVKHYIDNADPAKTLEIGNVLWHYYKTSHAVVDKYEVAPGVLNCDVVDLDTSHKYDLIVTISTLEHVGFDETPQDPTKVLVALETIKKALAPDGLLIVTVPLGQNPNLNAHIRERRFAFDEEIFLQKVSALNTWKQVDRVTALSCRYGYPYVAANAIMIGLFRNKNM